MSAFRVAIVRIQGLEIGVVSVDDSVLDDPVQRDDHLRWWQEEFLRPVLLFGTGSYRAYGQGDVGLLDLRLDPEKISWWSLTIDSPRKPAGNVRRPRLSNSARFVRPTR